jgi:hypothetical protein
MDSADVLLKHWEDQRAASRQSEEQRATLTNILLAISAVALGLISQQGLSRSMLAVTAALTFVGLFGAIASEKLYERFAWHNKQARELSEQLETIVPGLNLKEPYSRARQQHRVKYKRINKIRLHWIWTTLHLATAATGLLLTLVILFA